MVVKLSTLLVPKSHSGSFPEHLRRTLLPQYEGVAGLRTVLLLSRQFVTYTEAGVLSIWEPKEALNKFAAERPDARLDAEDLVSQRDSYTYTVVTLLENAKSH